MATTSFPSTTPLTNLPLPLTELPSKTVPIHKNPSRKDQQPPSKKSDPTKAIIPLLPNPIMNLSYVLGFTSTNCPKVMFNSASEYDYNNPNNTNPNKKHIFFCSGPTLVKFAPDTLKQQFFSGHSLPITNYTLACNGELLFTCQEGPNSLIRIVYSQDPRKDAINLLTTPYERINILSENKTSKYLCTVGSLQNKDVIIIWNISDLSKINAFIQKKAPASITQMMFSPYEPNVLISAGRENIKFWRINHNTKDLIYKSVVLHKYAKNVEFLSIAFSTSLIGDEYAKDKGKVYIGSSNGCVFQIACNNQELEAVYKVQDKAILSMTVTEAFCVTGSLDGYLRVWPIDFTKFLIEAKHDSGVCSVDLSYDNIEVLCGTLNGSVGLLNIQTKQYKTIIRSPPSKIQQMIAHPSGDFLFTIEDDKSVRVWDIEHKSEAFQFLSSKDPPTALAAPKLLCFACGFASGIIKIFDLEKIEILYESKPFKSTVTALAFIQRDKYLIAMSAQGNISIHDSTNKYMQCKILKIDPETHITDLSLSVDKDYFASIGPEAKCALVWDSESFGIKNRISMKEQISKVCLVHKNLIGVLFDSTCSVRFYALATYGGIPIKEIKDIHINGITHFNISKNYKFFISGGLEGMIKIWDFKMAYKRLISNQKFIGHSTGIRSIVLIENKSLLISASENSGIYFWNFLGDITFTESEISKELEMFGDADYTTRFTMHNITTTNSNNCSTLSQASFNKKAKQHLQQNANMNTTSNIRMKHMENVYKATKKEEKVQDEQQQQQQHQSKVVNESNINVGNATTLAMLPVIEDTSSIEVNFANETNGITQERLDKYTTTLGDNVEMNQQLNEKLLFKSNYCTSVSNDNFILPTPDNQSHVAKMKYVLGISTKSMRNVIYNADEWYAYTVNNKIIIESLCNDGDRIQKVLINSKDELSCLTMSYDKQYLITAIGCVNRERYAAIMLYETKTFSLYKKLNFHSKGVQCVKVSNNGYYMVSLGVKEEKSICVWNFTNLTVIDSKSVNNFANPIFDVVICENANSYITNTNLYFVTACSDMISCWRMDNTNYKLEGVNLKYKSIVNDAPITGEAFTAIAVVANNTHSFKNESTTNNNNSMWFYLVSTNKGNIYIIDKQHLYRKLMISKFPLTHLCYCEDTFICCGEGLIVFHWNVPQVGHNSGVHPFSFFETQKPNLSFLEAPVTSLSVNAISPTGLILTSASSLYIFNFKTKQHLKILSAHTQCNIPSLTTDKTNSTLLSCGNDGTIQCYTTDSYDQKFQLTTNTAQLQQPNKVLINETDSILITQYDSSYLRLYNFTTLLNLGIIKLKDADIRVFDLLFAEQALLVSTNHEQLFLIDVRNWEPLSLLHSELNPVPLTIPTNQFCKSLQCKDITRDKSYAVCAYGDGTVITFLIEKIKNKIEATTLDTFNVIETHLQHNDDTNIREMYEHISKVKNDYICNAHFSRMYDGISFCFHECLQFLYMRNYLKKEMIKIVPLNYFPLTFDINKDETRIAVGTRESVVLIINKKGESFVNGYSVDNVYGCYDVVNEVTFGGGSNNNTLYVSSFNEVIVFNLS